MTFALAFWILMLLWLVFGPAWQTGNWPHIGASLLLFLLILLLGWRVFGQPLHI